jgi:hypothetical protein
MFGTRQIFVFFYLRQFHGLPTLIGKYSEFWKNQTFTVTQSFTLLDICPMTNVHRSGFGKCRMSDTEDIKELQIENTVIAGQIKV